jgi:ATP-dependent Clp protease ATP-binding subunit ClpC
VISSLPDEIANRLSQRARETLLRTVDEAARLNHNYIGTEHQLLALLGDKESVGARVLNGLGVELPVVRDEVESMIGRGEGPVTGEIGPTPRATRVMELAVQEAQKLAHLYIGTEHILLGIVAEGEGVAAGILERLGATLPTVRSQILALLKKDNVVTCRINDRDLEALDMLVESGVRTTRSAAAAWLIHAGIVANKELFDRIGNTIGEIARLRKEAQQMAISSAASGGPGGA